MPISPYWSTPFYGQRCPTVTRSTDEYHHLGVSRQTEVRPAHPRFRATAAARQEPHAADRPAARRRHPAAAGPARSAGPDHDAGDRTVLRGDERRRRRDLRQPAAAVRDRRRDRLRQEGGRLDRAGRRPPATWSSRPSSRPCRRSCCATCVNDQAGEQAQINYSVFAGIAGRPGHRLAVRPLPQHPAALVSRLLRRPALRADRHLAGLPDHGLRAELLLPDLQRRPDRGRRVHRWHRGRSARSSTASPTAC